MNDSDKEPKEIVLRDLEPVLRQRLGDKVIVESFTSDSLLPPGENYGSTILSVHVDYKNGQAGKKEELNLIAKMLPPTEFQRRIFNSSRTFIKEIFMYETVMPAYNKLEMECGLRKNEMFDILPKFYGSRMSMRSDLEFDDNAVFLMDNLKVKGYYTGNRNIGGFNCLYPPAGDTRFQVILIRPNFDAVSILNANYSQDYKVPVNLGISLNTYG